MAATVRARRRGSPSAEEQHLGRPVRPKLSGQPCENVTTGPLPQSLIDQRPSFALSCSSVPSLAVDAGRADGSGPPSMPGHNTQCSLSLTKRFLVVSRKPRARSRRFVVSPSRARRHPSSRSPSRLPSHSRSRSDGRAERANLVARSSARREGLWLGWGRRAARGSVDHTGFAAAHPRIRRPRRRP